MASKPTTIAEKLDAEEVEYRVCDFFFNSLEHFENDYVNDIEAVKFLGVMIQDDARARNLMVAWRDLPSSNPLWLALRTPERGDVTMRNWIRAIA